MKKLLGTTALASLMLVSNMAWAQNMPSNCVASFTNTNNPADRNERNTGQLKLERKLKMIHVLLDPKIYDKAPPAHYPPPFSITVTSESATSIVFHYTNNTGVRVDGSMDLVGGKWVVGLIPNITGAARATGNCTPTTTTATGVAGSEG